MSDNLEGLINPDDDDSGEDKSYDWPDEFLQSILGSLVSDSYFLIQSAGLIKPSYFRESAHQFICRKVLEYFEKYNGKPKKGYLAAEIEDNFKDDDKKGYYYAELETIYQAYEPELHIRDMFLDKITEFAKTQALRLAYNKTLGFFQAKRKDKWERIREVLEEALLVERNVDLGLEYFETLEERYKRMMKAQESQEHFPTGIERIDAALDGGLHRGEIASFAGMSGAGKSLFLVKTGVSCIRKGWDVLYVSLEMDQDSVAERFDSMLTSVPIKELYKSSNPQKVFEVLYESVSYWGNLVIKQFAAGSADTTSIRAFINQLHVSGFEPDVVIIDYVGEFRDVPGLKTYESRQRLVRDLRGMATELNIGLFTAMQVNRGGRDAMKEKGYLDDSDLSSSFDQITPLDFLWTLSQTEVEQKANCGVLYASKHRRGPGRFMVQFQRDTNTLEMNEISLEKYRLELNKVADKTVEELAIEDLARDAWLPNKGAGDSIKMQLKDKENA